MVETVYQVQLPSFQGPLELLLSLVERAEVDIRRISLAVIVESYLEYLAGQDEVDLDALSEFLLLAAALVRLKAGVLLPEDQPVPAAEDDAGSGSLEDLAAQFLEYRRFQEAAQGLLMLYQESARLFPRGAAPAVPETGNDRNPGGGKSLAVDPGDAGAETGNLSEGSGGAGGSSGSPQDPGFKSGERSEEMDREVSLEDLVGAFAEVLRRAPPGGEIHREEINIEERIQDIIRRLQDGGGAMTFRSLFSAGNSKAVVIVTFLALLQLVRSGLLALVQKKLFGEITLRLKKTPRLKTGVEAGEDRRLPIPSRRVRPVGLPDRDPD
ncbi:MAG: segregation/condensation protein A [Firmicutes bacterium]|nr:segregation/condensation protein A [Bacillota bacterium]